MYSLLEPFHSAACSPCTCHKDKLYVVQIKFPFVEKKLIIILPHLVPGHGIVVAYKRGFLGRCLGSG